MHAGSRNNVNVFISFRFEAPSLCVAAARPCVLRCDDTRRLAAFLEPDTHGFPEESLFRQNDTRIHCSRTLLLLLTPSLLGVVWEVLVHDVSTQETSRNPPEEAMPGLSQLSERLSVQRIQHVRPERAARPSRIDR